MAQFAAAYQLGAAESGAAVNLLRNITPSVKNALTELVARFTMPKFLTHEPLASGWFNNDYCSGTGTLQSWSKALTNTEGLAKLLVSRMEKDYVALAIKMRKPWGKEVEPWK